MLTAKLALRNRIEAVREWENKIESAREGEIHPAKSLTHASCGIGLDSLVDRSGATNNQFTPFAIDSVEVCVCEWYNALAR